MVATIIENGIRVYKNHFCLCGCHTRIPWRDYHKHSSHVIPRYIQGHQPRCTKKKLHLKKEILWKETIIEDGILKYKNYFCHCSCKQRIHYPKTKHSLIRHKALGVPKYIQSHQPKKKGGCVFDNF